MIGPHRRWRVYDQFDVLQGTYPTREQAEMNKAWGDYVIPDRVWERIQYGEYEDAPEASDGSDVDPTRIGTVGGREAPTSDVSGHPTKDPRPSHRPDEGPLDPDRKLLWQIWETLRPDLDEEDGHTISGADFFAWMCERMLKWKRDQT